MPHFKLSINQLLGFVLGCALVAWTFSLVGTTNPLFWVPVTIALISSTIFLLLASDQRLRVRQVTWLIPLGTLALAALGCGVFVSLFLLLHTVCLFAFSLVAIRWPQRTESQWLRILSVQMLVIMAVCTYIGLSQSRSLYDLQAQYPSESLESRLAGLRPSLVKDPAAALNPIVQQQLDEQQQAETLNGTALRRYSLSTLHDRSYVQFVNALGFGVTRMEGIYRNDLEIDPIQDISLHAPEPTQPPRSFFRHSEVVSVDNLPKLHWHSRWDFFDPDSLGAVIEPIKRVAGFQSHSFAFSPQLLIDPPLKVEIKRLELVSLLRFPEPRVYELDHLPRMDQLATHSAKTRALDDFETANLSKLVSEQDIVIEESPERIRMLGSLRASRSCLDCHEVQLGTLLGAFTYELTPTP